MVRKLRIRFTLASSLILLVVLSVIGVAINMMNYYNFMASTEKTMSVIAENNGEFPDYEDYLKMLEEERLREEMERETEEGTETDDVDPDETSPAETEEPPETSTLEKFDYTAGFGFGLKVTAETAYETRYFYVRFTPDGSMIGYDLSHIAEVTMEDAESLGRAGSSRGIDTTDCGEGGVSGGTGPCGGQKSGQSAGHGPHDRLSGKRKA